MANALLQKEVSEGKVRILTEKCSIDTQKEGVSVVGLALPFNKVSRNGNFYVQKSIEDNAEGLIGKPVLFNHNENHVIGHVTNISMGEDGLHYEMDLDPEESIAKKVKRGDLSNVSIQVLLDDSQTVYDEEKGVLNAYISEFLELSIVSIAGFADTTALVVEKFKGKVQTINAHAEQKSTSKTNKQNSEKVSKGENMPEDEQPTEQPKDELTMESLDAKLSDVVESCGKLSERMSAMESKFEELQKDDTEKEPVTEQDDEMDNEDKKEEAIRKNKKVTTEKMMPQDIEISASDLCSAMKFE